MCRRLAARVRWQANLGLGLLAMLGSALAILAAEPRRVVLPLFRDSSGYETADKIRPVFRSYLHERLAECPGVRVVSDERAAAILGQLTDGSRDIPAGQLAAQFSEALPVDAVVLAEYRDGILIVASHAAKGTERKEFPPAKSGHQAVVQAAAAWLAELWGLSAAEKAILAEVRVKDDAAFTAGHYTRIIWAPWPQNPAEYRLKMLSSLVGKNAADGYLPSRVLEEADYFFRATRRAQEYAKSAEGMAVLYLPAVLGTPYEASAHAIAKAKPALFEKDLLLMAGRLLGDGLETGTDLRPDDTTDATDSGDRQGGDSVEKMADPRQASRAQQLGALRVLGAMQSKAGLKTILAAAGEPAAEVREAAAAALQTTAEAKAIDALRKLAEDENPRVAFAAGHSLWLQKLPPPNLVAVARQQLADKGCTRESDGVAVLAALGTTADVPLLTRLRAAAASPETRHLAATGLLRLKAVSGDAFAALLEDPDQRTVIAALGQFPPDAAPPLRTRLMALATDPENSVSEAAQMALPPLRPAAGPERDAFDLAIEHPYLRMRLLDRWAETGAAALPRLLEACGNRDPHTRWHALELVNRLAPEQAYKPLLVALADPARWVRLHAAAALANTVRPEEREPLQKARATEKDPAIAAYLDGGLARCDQRAPARPAAARKVDPNRNLTWLCGFGGDVAESPLQAYYNLTADVSDTWKAAYTKSGKIFFGRVETVGNPGLILTDPQWLDRFWLSLNSQLPPENLPFLDGVVYGEETMKIDPAGLWPTGWRLFCVDAGIDPARVAGDTAKLTPPQQAAWRYWALERCVDGFNRLYDYTKLRLGVLRPGLQVATFVPEQSLLDVGPVPNARRWRFDVGGVYDYKNCNRIAAYTLVRRMKTLWPDRPVLWLSLGIGGYEMNPARYNLDTPKVPLTSRGDRAYADSISAWLAGAQTGWFSTWIFVAHDFKGSGLSMSGVQILMEDITPDSALLRRGIDYAFRGVDKVYDLKDTKKPDLQDKEGAEGNSPEEDLEDPAAKADEIKARIEKEKATMLSGFLFYGQYLYTCARLFQDLPRPATTLPALIVRPGISVWTPGAPLAPIPGQDVLSSFDAVCDINTLAGLTLAKYRCIAVEPPPVFRDATLAAIGAWLKETPGLLYVHGQLSPDNAAEESTPEDMDARLQRDWPWEADVTAQAATAAAKPQGKAAAGAATVALTGEAGPLELAAAQVTTTYACNGGRAKVLLAHNDQPVLVLWRHPDYRGAVLFDGMSLCGADYLQALRRVINNLKAKDGIGLELTGPALYQAIQDGPVTALTTSGYYANAKERLPLQGLDALTGEANPTLGPGRDAAILLTEFTGRYAAAHDGLGVLADKPLEGVEKQPKALRLKTAGLLRVATLGGTPQVQTAAGAALPEVPADKATAWLLTGTADGLLVQPFSAKDPARGSVTYVRSAQPVRITRP